ncbi:YmfQ family protein [Longicatena sp. 210702-DFI.1.36]|uniref:putative phage tail protein n=1 Tax=Longicatena TaxID=1918536 RepID=UPI001D088D3B|nr:MULTISPECIES: putative phage tail protein [Longicatena]MCB6265543.1 YmfQ family protein [Longicatena sp. 210702-DFI.1.160]MCB6316304.1 YmfQ family protein [Longicatena sp. 210702-DFI.1.100]MCB6430093.1 YmfQ family protein [Longicatena sp. 210702-DFI.1.36]MCB6432974.1 YmfQ family protein [Longicatena sp. 210702-DFI.1.249]MCB6439735.1 YmfQ family protein [Longicatena sp. 210702-DFI.1.255]
MIREVNLLSFLPEFVQEYREIKHIMNSEQPEIQKLEDETEIIKNNQFILSCDIDGIARFENLLGITPKPDDTLDARKSRVITRWNNSIPYTYKGLKEKLNVMCGEGNYLLIPSFNEYGLEIVVSLPLSGQADELDYMLSYMIPANIVVTSRNNMVRTMTGTVHGGGTTIETSNFTLQSKVNLDHVLNSLMTGTGVVVSNIERTIN